MESFMHGDIGTKYFIKKCYYIQQYFKLNGSLQMFKLDSPPKKLFGT